MCVRESVRVCVRERVCVSVCVKIEEGRGLCQLEEKVNRFLVQTIFRKMS